MFWRSIFLTVLHVIALCSCAQPARSSEISVEFFEKKIRPLLVAHCYECHAEESSADSAHLRLDSRQGWLRGGDSGPAIDLENPRESLLLQAVSYRNPDLQMPPRSKLPDREIELLHRWIEAGAPAPDEAAGGSSTGGETFDLEARRKAHWAWQGVIPPAIPEVRSPDWARDEIDRFVLAKLEAAGLAPAADADRATWLRRVTFDLTGLPPTPDALDAFLQDQSPGAFERVVDRLLANPAFGECWGQHWLDLVRFADTKGHEQDFPIPHAWRYRDYVIRALNANIPYDQFVIEHIAGDLLADPRMDPATRTNQSIQGTGFWHLGDATHSPVDIRGDEAERVDNQIDVLGKAFLGMTVACARCHDHKFDAISTDDYYALCGFLQSSSYQEANVADPQLRNAIARQLRQVQAAAARRVASAYRRHVQTRVRDWLRSPQSLLEGSSLDAELQTAIGERGHPLHLLAVAIDAESHGQSVSSAIDAAMNGPRPVAKDLPEVDLQSIIDFSAAPLPLPYADWRTSGLAFGEAPISSGTLVLHLENSPVPFRVVEQAAASNEQLSSQLTGMYRTRTFEVTRPSLWYLYRGKANVFLAVDSHRTVEGPLHQVVKLELSQAADWTWKRHDAGDYLGHRIHVEFAPDGDFALGAVGFADEKPRVPTTLNSTVAKAVRDAGAETVSDVAGGIANALVVALEAIESAAAGSDEARLANWLVAHDELLPPPHLDTADAVTRELQEYRAERRELETKLPAAEYALALLDGSGVDEHVHLRGSHKRVAKDPTPRRMLSALGGEFDIPYGSGRLELAERVASSANPLTSRVFVNRVWAHLTGRGIVRTVDNFGVLGDRPTHPLLLDFLAAEFVDSGWNVKQIIRRIVLSSTYRQASAPSSETSQEIIASRDPTNQLLHCARVRRIPAESIRDSLFAVAGVLDRKSFGPSVPVHITDFMRHNRSPDASGPMDGERRRSVYIEYRRNGLNHFLTAFDKPLPSTTLGHRHQSNSAAQPLMLLNDPLVHELTKTWANYLAASFADDAAAINAAYQAAFGRPPVESERTAILNFLQQRQDERPEAWSDVCLALINSKEFIFLR